MWQSPCKVGPVRRLDGSQILLGLVSGSINTLVGAGKIDKNPWPSGFLYKGKHDEDRDVITYPYAVELVFTNIEQAIMFLRFLVLHRGSRSLPPRGRRSRWRGGPRVRDLHGIAAIDIIALHTRQVPEQHYYTRVNATTAPELEAFHNKYLFSKLRMVQRKALIIARVIARG